VTTLSTPYWERREREWNESPAGVARALMKEKIRIAQAREARRVAEGRPYIINRDDEGNPITDPNWTKSGLDSFDAGPARPRILSSELQARAVRDVVNNPDIPLREIARRHGVSHKRLQQMMAAAGVVRAERSDALMATTRRLELKPVDDDDGEVSVNCELGAHERCTSCGCRCHRT
jgi:hypothetical protein